MRYLSLILVLVGALTLSACGSENNSTTNQASVIESPEPTVSADATVQVTAEPTSEITEAPSVEPSATADDKEMATMNSSTPVITKGVKSKPTSTPSVAPSTGKHTSKPASSPSASPVKTDDKGKKASVTEKPVSTEHVVEIINFGFSPAKVEIKVGDTVKFVNRDEIRHSATADDKSFNTELLGKDESKTVTFNQAGEFGFYCMPHPGMRGSIIVEAN